MNIATLHTVMDTTAILKLIETRFNLPSLTARVGIFVCNGGVKLQTFVLSKPSLQLSSFAKIYMMLAGVKVFESGIRFRILRIVFDLAL